MESIRLRARSPSSSPPFPPCSGAAPVATPKEEAGKARGVCHSYCMGASFDRRWIGVEGLPVPGGAGKRRMVDTSEEEREKLSDTVEGSRGRLSCFGKDAAWTWYVLRVCRC